LAVKWTSRPKNSNKNIENAHIERVGEGIAITFDSGLLFGFDSAEVQQYFQGEP
jgi:hypothetical protein